MFGERGRSENANSAAIGDVTLDILKKVWDEFDYPLDVVRVLAYNIINIYNFMSF